MKKTSKLLIVLCAFITAFAAGCSSDKEEELPKFKVTFESNGGSTVGTQDIEAGSKAIKPTDPTKDNAIFGGWFADQELTTTWDFAKDIIMDKSITLYAKWTSQYTVVFDAKGGAPTPDTLKVETGSKITKPANPIMENGMFLGWYTDETFTVEWDFETDVVTSNLFLFAKWTMDHIVTFDAQGGTPTPPQQDVKDGERIAEPTPEPTKEGYRFEEWNTEADGNGSKWNFNETVFSSRTLYARWTETITYTITFETNGGGEIESQKVSQGEQATKPKDPVKGEFTFGGWYTDEGLYNTYDFEESVYDNKVLYAKWVAQGEEFKVTFMYQNPIDLQIYEHMDTTVHTASKLSEPKMPEFEHHVLSFWYDNSQNEPIWDFENDGVTRDMQLFAVYKRVYYIEFDANGGTPTPTTQTVIEGNKIIEPTGVTNGNKTLEGWSAPLKIDPPKPTRNDMESKWDFSRTLSRDFADAGETVTLTAIWVETITITFKNGEDVYNTKTVKQGNKLPEPPPPTTPPAGSEGATFIGWSPIAGEQSDLWDFSSDLVETTTTLHAIWAAGEQTHTVTFTLSKDDNTPYKTISGIKHNETIKEVFENPTSDNQKFENWYYANGGGDSPFYMNTRITSDMHVYAKWLNYYTVSFDTEGGSTPPAKQKVVEGQNVKKPSTNPTKEGYVFLYWEIEEEKDSGYRNEYNFNEWNSVNKSFTLYAKWVVAGEMVTVNYYDEKSDEPIYTEQVAIGETIEPYVAPDKEGQIFVGWINQNNGNIWDFSAPILENISFEARYVNEGDIVQVMFNNHNKGSDNWVAGGNNYPPQDISMGNLVTEPTTPVSYTHTFMGWYTEETAGKEWDFANDKVLTSNHMYLYARWGNPHPDARLYRHIQDIKEIYYYSSSHLYTTESWRAFEKAITDVEMEIVNSTLTDVQVEEGIAALNQAVGNLVKKQIGATERIEIGDRTLFDGQGNLMLIADDQNQTRIPLASYTYSQMQELGQSNYLDVKTYDADGNKTSTTTQAYGDDDMWEWIYGIDEGFDGGGETRIEIRVKESGTSGKLTLRADKTELVLPVKHYTYNQAKSLLITGMRELPAPEELDYRHFELVDKLSNLASTLGNINYSDSEVQAAQGKLEDYDIYKLPIERDGANTAIIEDEDFTYTEIGGFPYGEYLDEWYFDSYDGKYSQYKMVLKTDGTFQDLYRESTTVNESIAWEESDKGTLSINPNDVNTDKKYYVYLAYSYEEGSRSIQSRATSKKGKSPLSKIIEKLKAEKQAARN